MNARTLALLQGWFYAITGLWPVVDIDSFMLVTGGKVDIWLVKTVGLLLFATGAALLVSARSTRVPPGIALIAALDAALLTAVDVKYALSGVISKVYLLDSVVEIAIVVAWITAKNIEASEFKSHSRPEPVANSSSK